MKKTKLLLSLLICSIIFSINISCIFAGTMLTYDGKTVEYTASPIILKINGEIIDQSTLPMQPIIIDGNTLVPAREVFETLGAIVDYKDETKEIYIAYNDDLINMQINNYNYSVNGQSYTFNVPPKNINGKTMIPVRAVSEGMGLIVDWDDYTRTISIDEPTTIDPENPDTIISPTESAIDVSPYDFTQSNSDKTTLNSIDTSSNSITINLNSSISALSKMLLEDNRLVIDLINCDNTISSSTIQSDSPYFSEIRTSQFATDPTSISRVVVNVNSGVYFSVILSNDRKTVKIFFGDENTKFPTELGSNDSINTDNNNDNTPDTSTDDNTNIDDNTDTSTDNNTDTVVPEGDYLTFDWNTHSIVISKDTGVTKDSITIDDTDAFRKNIIVNFSSDLSNYFITGSTSIFDTYINSFTHSVENGKSKLAVQLNSWGTLKVTENNDEIYITFANPKEIYDKIVVIDAGHGGTDVGTTGNNMLEKDLNLNVALKFGDMVTKETNIKVYYTRIDDTLLDLEEIGQFASVMGDLLFSVHTNGFDTDVPNGVETLYLEHSNDATVGITSQQCAEIVQKNLAEDTGLYNRGIKRSNLVIFRNCTVPSVLGEMGFITNSIDAKYLADDSYLTLVAKSYADSTKEIFDIYTPAR